jgi:hypothetical protein
MPIKRVVSLAKPGSGLPIIARLHKGDKKPVEGNRPGADLDHFRVEFRPGFEHLAEDFTRIYGAQPARFEDVYLLGETVDEVFEFWMQKGDATTMHRQCDGETIHRWYDKSTGRYNNTHIACQCASLPEKDRCKESASLRFALMGFTQVTGMLGYFVAHTSSQTDIFAIYKALNDIGRLAGRLNGIQMIFGRASQSISAPKQVKRDGTYVVDGRIRTEKSLLYLHVHPDSARLLMAVPAAPELPAYVDSDGVVHTTPALPEPVNAPESSVVIDLEDLCAQAVKEFPDFLPEELERLVREMADGFKFANTKTTKQRMIILRGKLASLPRQEVPF